MMREVFGIEAVPVEAKSTMPIHKISGAYLQKRFDFSERFI